jgi:hypothetical protein
MTRVLTITHHGLVAIVKRESTTRKYRMTPSSRRRAIRLMRENEAMRDSRAKRKYFVESTTGL